jgi:hypothetical protein
VCVCLELSWIIEVMYERRGSLGGGIEDGSVLEEEVIIDGDTSAGLEEVINALLLSEEGVDERLVVGGEGSLEEVAKEGEDIMEASPVLIILGLEGDSLEYLHEDGKIKDDGGSKEGVFTHVVDIEEVLTTKEDLTSVLIESLLSITSRWDILDDNHVVDTLLLLLIGEHIARFNHVINTTLL